MAESDTPVTAARQRMRNLTILQYYSSLPLNIASGATTIQGTAGRPLVNDDFIGRNIGVGPDLFSLNLRLTPPFTITDQVKLEAIAEGFNALNHRNDLTKITANEGFSLRVSEPILRTGSCCSNLDGNL